MSGVVSAVLNSDEFSTVSQFPGVAWLVHLLSSVGSEKKSLFTDLCCGLN
jgi:hypothetical protein